MGRVSGNHDNMGHFLVAVETCGGVWGWLLAKLAWPLRVGTGSPSSRARLLVSGSPLPPRGQGSCVPWDAHSQPPGGWVEGGGCIGWMGRMRRTKAKG